MELTVTIDITAVEFRRLNSFEWALLSLLNTFQADAPTIADATAQLCIGEPAFLTTAFENLRSVHALQPRTDELRQLEMKDYELSDFGSTILREDGWEAREEESMTEDFAIDWPTLKHLSHRKVSKHRQHEHDLPKPDEVQEKLTMQSVEDLLNCIDKERYRRVKTFYVTNVAI